MSYLTDWHLESGFTTIVLFAILYAIGWSRRVDRGGALADAALAATGAGVLAVALASPLAALAERLFWAHMAQHVLFLAVAPPLILLGRPWTTAWRGLPLQVRRRIAPGVVGGRWGRPVRAFARVLSWPPFALAIFCGVLFAWHVPALFDATLRVPAVHVTEHLAFLAAGLVLWSQLIDSPPLRSRLGYPIRALYATAAIAAGTALTVVLVLAPEPLYAGYAQLASRPGGISALADQRLAAGIMWIPGSIPFVAALLVFAARWLESEAGGRKAAMPVGER